MTLRLAALAALLVLAGCSDADWDSTMYRVGLGDAPTSVVRRAPAPVRSAIQAAAPARALSAAQPPAADPFCQSVASQDAAGNGFDPATQRNVFALSYAQCLTVFGPGH